MIWRTAEGYEYCGVVECYGRLVDSCGERWREVCEARAIMDLAIERRRSEMAILAKKRGHGEKHLEDAIKARLEHLLTEEWKWRKARKAEREAAAA